MAFACKSDDRLILELVTKNRIGRSGRIAERKEHRHHIRVARFGRVSAPILVVVALARASVEIRAQTTRCDG